MASSTKGGALREPLLLAIVNCLHHFVFFAKNDPEILYNLIWPALSLLSRGRISDELQSACKKIWAIEFHPSKTQESHNVMENWRRSRHFGVLIFDFWRVGIRFLMTKSESVWKASIITARDMLFWPCYYILITFADIHQPHQPCKHTGVYEKHVGEKQVSRPFPAVPAALDA